MAFYKIYAGLNGGFGGARFVHTIECDTEEFAGEEAYAYAIEEYESMEGYHGLRSEYDIMEEDGVDADEAVEIYREEREDWLDYYAVETDSIDDYDE